MPRRRRIKWYVGAACVVGAVAVSGGVALANAPAGPSLHSSSGGSGPGTVSGPNGEFVPGKGAVPPSPPAGSTSYGSKASGSGMTVTSH
jgi:hypothetical protein